MWLWEAGAVDREFWKQTKIELTTLRIRMAAAGGQPQSVTITFTIR